MPVGLQSHFLSVHSSLSLSSLLFSFTLFTSPPDFISDSPDYRDRSARGFIAPRAELLPAVMMAKGGGKENKKSFVQIG